MFNWWHSKFCGYMTFTILVQLSVLIILFLYCLSVGIQLHSLCGEQHVEVSLQVEQKSRDLAHRASSWWEKIPYLPLKFIVVLYLPLRKFSFPICHWAKLRFPFCHFRLSVRITMLESRWKDHFILRTNFVVKFGNLFTTLISLSTLICQKCYSTALQCLGPV